MNFEILTWEIVVRLKTIEGERGAFPHRIGSCTLVDEQLYIVFKFKYKNCGYRDQWF